MLITEGSRMPERHKSYGRLHEQLSKLPPIALGKIFHWWIRVQNVPICIHDVIAEWLVCFPNLPPKSERFASDFNHSIMVLVIGTCLQKSLSHTIWTSLRIF